MKKIEIDTVCGEKTVVYVSQDVDTITIDGEEYMTNQVLKTKHIKMRFNGGYYYATITSFDGDFDESVQRIEQQIDKEDVRTETGSLIFVPNITPKGLL